MFNYEQRNGDFDVKVRLQGLELSDAWAKAGLMARESLSTVSRYVGAFGTPSVSGCFLQYRTATSGSTTRIGSWKTLSILSARRTDVV